MISSPPARKERLLKGRQISQMFLWWLRLTLSTTRARSTHRGHTPPARGMAKQRSPTTSPAACVKPRVKRVSFSSVVGVVAVAVAVVVIAHVSRFGLHWRKTPPPVIQPEVTQTTQCHIRVLLTTTHSVLFWDPSFFDLTSHIFVKVISVNASLEPK